MQEIAQGYVKSLSMDDHRLIFFSVTRVQDIQLVCEAFFASSVANMLPSASNLTKLCHVFIPGLWRKRPSNGERSTR